MKQSVQAIAFRKKENYEFLLLKRIPTKGGFWQPAGGALEDESLLEGAYRELQEETSINKDNILRAFENVHEHEFEKENIKTQENVFAFEVSPETEVSIHNNIYPEHEEFMWVSYSTALEMLKWDSNKESFKRLKDLI
jgi:dihydroneopterin triphosphate diphosphatase